jgi:His-Xaa-Ser repeat protein HxsA
MKKFLITTLAAAGFANISDSNALSASNEEIFEKKDQIKDVVKREMPYTLLAHNSHASHNSHSSHYSHSSYQRNNYTPKDQKNNEYKSRNASSTPPTSILPRSPAIVDDFKLSKENIKGSSKTFRELTKRVQLALYATGYYSGSISGTFSDELKVSIIKYQTSNNLKATGTLSDNLLLNLLGPNVEVQKN